MKNHTPASTVGRLMMLSGRLALAQPAGANLVANGSSEDPGIPQDSFVLFTVIPGWTRYFGSAIEVEDRLVANLLLPAYDGFQQVELDSTGNTGIRQTNHISPDGLSNLSLAHSPRPGFGAATNTFEVLWDGSIAGTYDRSGIGSTQVAWTLENVPIKALAGDHILGVQATGTKVSVGGLVEAVSIEAGPEAATWVLAAVEIVPFAFFRRSNRTAGRES